MSKITNDGLTRFGTGGCYSCADMATVGVKGLNNTGRYRLFVWQWDYRYVSLSAFVTRI